LSYSFAIVPEYNYEPTLFFVAAVEQLVAHDIKLGDQELTADSIAAMKNELANEKQA
jgi:hypothetical protein